MRPAWRKYLDQNAPRYTSYPSALNFGDDIGPADLVAGLEKIGNYEPISLYVHIPYCRQRCWYCGCNMRVENRYDRAIQYVDVLIDEISNVAALLGGRGQLTQVHFGGGTPNYLQPDDLAKIIDAIEISLGLTDTTPIAMELDPRLCTPEAMAQLVAQGVSRVSLGVQDFDERVQHAIHRVQPYGLVEDCMAALRGMAIDDVSFDLLYGLPKQTLCTFRETIRKTLALNPDRVSLFGYTHMPSKFPHQRMILDDDLPDRCLRAVLAESADRALIADGYMPIGFDHYARPHSPIAQAARHGRLNRNFQGYTEDPSDIVIGVGASAITSMPDLHVQNHKDLRAYMTAIRKSGFAAARGVRAGLFEEELGLWLKRLLCDRRANLADYYNIAQPTPGDVSVINQMLNAMVQDEIVTVEGDDLLVLDEAKPLLPSVAAIFDPAVRIQNRAVSPAV